MAEKQKTLWIQENRNIDRVNIPVEFGKNLTNMELNWRWQRIRELCYPVKGIGGGLHMVIDSRWSLPITPYPEVVDEDKLALLTDEDEIFHSSFNDTKEMSEKERRKADTGDRLVVALMIVLAGLTFFFLMTGKIF